MKQWTTDIPAVLADATPATGVSGASGATGGWWWATLTSSAGLTYLAIAGGCVLAIVWMSWRLRRASAPLRARAAAAGRSGESGVATIEFVLVAPFLLTITLVLIQTMLVFTGLFYVNYAAYAAARSAIVYLPAEVGIDGPNTVTATRGMPKYDRIRAAAVIAVMPVCGREAEGDASVARIDVGLNRYFDAQGRDAPGWVDNLAQGRLNYADAHTFITLQTIEQLEGGDVVFRDATGVTDFGPSDAVAVQVRHEFALSVPVASQIFQLAGSRSDGANSGRYTPQTRQNSGGAPAPPGAWTAIRARAVLVNEGLPRRLPERPPVSREE